MDTDGALAGIRVLDLTRVVAGPYATMILADHGAEVLKIEQPTVGDETRTFPPFVSQESTYFMSLNRNKKSATVDLRSLEGQRQMREMLATADVVMHNFRGSFAREVRLDYASVSSLNPALIYCEISGFSKNGPYSSHPAYDLFVAGVGGLMSVTGEPGGPPQRPGISLVDYMTGLNAALGTMIALHARDASGLGQCVDVSMLSTLLSTTGVMVSAHAATGEVPAPGSHNQSSQIVPYGTFETTDGYINVGVINDKFWRSFCPLVGHPEWLRDPRFNTNARRVTHREELLTSLRPLFRAKSSQSWLMKLRTADIPCGPILSFDEVIADPEVKSSGMYTFVKHPTAGEVLVTAPPLRLSRTPATIRTPPPLLGGDKAEFRERKGES